MKNHTKRTIFLIFALSAAEAAWAIDSPPESASPATPTATSVQPVVSAPAPGHGFTGSYLSGLFARSEGDVKSAIRYLQEAHQKYPGNTELINQLQGLLLLEGKVKEAVALAEESQKLGGMDDSISILLLTLQALQNNDPVKARALLGGVDTAGSGQVWQPLILAWIDAGEKKITRQLTLEDINIGSGHASASVHYHLGLINAYSGFPEAATLNFRQAIDGMQAVPPRIMDVIASFWQRNGRPELLRKDVEPYIASAPDYAIHKEDEITNMREGVSEVLFTMGSIMMGAGITQDAAIYLRLTLFLRPDFAPAALALADTYGDLEQYARANEIYALVKEDNRYYLPAQMHVAINYERLGQMDKSLALLDRLAKKFPKRYETLTVKGDLLRMRGRFAEAAAAYTAAITRLPALEKQHWIILFARGVSYERQGKWNLAEKDLQKSLEINPEQPEVLNYLGYSWLTRGEHIQEAHDMLELAVARRPNDAQIVDSMGWAMYLLGRYDQAAAYIEKALDLIPSDPTVNDHLGDVYWRQGRITEARFQWERSLTYSPEAAAAEATRLKLREGLPAPTPAAAGKKTPPVVAAQQSPSVPVETSGSAVP